MFLVRENSLFSKSQWQTFLWFFVVSFLYELGESWQNTPMTIYIIGCCFAIMASKKKRVLSLFLTMASFLVFIMIQWFPVVANHVNFQIFIIFLLFFFFFKELWLGKIKSYDLKRSLFLCLFAVYFMSVIHKLNVDFFSPEYGCTTWMFSKANNWFNLDLIDSFPQWFFVVSPYIYISTLLMGSIFFLLPGLYRPIGIAIFIFLHAMLGLIGFADFSSICLSFYILLIPKKIWNESFKNYKVFKVMPFEKWYCSWAILMTIFTALSLYFSWFQRTHFQGLFLIIGAAPLVKKFVSSLRIEKTKNIWKKEKSLLRDSKISIFLPALLLIIFGLTPYLGVRSRGNFTMFSNLRVEGGVNNHLFIPQMDLFPFLKEVVWVKRINRQENISYGLVETDFRRQVLVDYEDKWLKQKNPLPVVIEYQGKEYIYDNIFSESFWLTDLGWYTYFLDFRSIQVDLENPNRCRL